MSSSTSSIGRMPERLVQIRAAERATVVGAAVGDLQDVAIGLAWRPDDHALVSHGPIMRGCTATSNSWLAQPGVRTAGQAGSGARCRRYSFGNSLIRRVARQRAQPSRATSAAITGPRNSGLLSNWRKINGGFARGGAWRLHAQPSFLGILYRRTAPERWRRHTAARQLPASRSRGDTSRLLRPERPPDTRSPAASPPLSQAADCPRYGSRCDTRSGALRETRRRGWRGGSRRNRPPISGRCQCRSTRSGRREASTSGSSLRG